MTHEEAKVELSRIHVAVNDHYRGKRATIVSDYNGQPHGHSRRSQRGTVVEIERVEFLGADIHFFVKGKLLGLSPDELEVVE